MGIVRYGDVDNYCTLDQPNIATRMTTVPLSRTPPGLILRTYEYYTPTRYYISDSTTQFQGTVRSRRCCTAKVVAKDGVFTSPLVPQ